MFNLECFGQGQLRPKREAVSKNYSSVFKRRASYISRISSIYNHGPGSESRAGFLGKMFMRLDLGIRSAGQFFTPYHVCELMAEVVATNALER